MVVSGLPGESLALQTGSGQVVYPGDSRPIWADVEIVYAYRLRQMLADKKPVIAPMDQNDWARNLGCSETPPAELIALYGLESAWEHAIAAAPLSRRILASQPIIPRRNRILPWPS